MMTMASMYMGSVVTSLFTQTRADQEVLMYGTITGELGVLSPMNTNVDVLTRLESLMMNDASPVCRVIDDYHSLFLPVKVGEG